MIIDSYIDKALVKSLVTHIGQQMDAFSNSLSNKRSLDFALVGEHFMFAVLKAVRAVTDDQAEETEMVTQVIHGAMHACLQGAICTAPPAYRSAIEQEQIVVN